MSRDIPIIFSAAMVQALLSGRKTMTRRLATREVDMMQKAKRFATGQRVTVGLKVVPSAWQNVQPGDRLWTRENWGCPSADRPGVPDGRKPQVGDRIVYMANDADAAQWQTGHPGCADFQWRPSIHQPRWASRMTLIVAAVKVERLHAMSHDDAIAEGVELTEAGFGVRGPQGGWLGTTFSTPAAAFSYLWISLHGSQSWDANPEVVALSFRVVEANIDAPEAQAAK